jgi:hypothetical protein
VFTSIKSLKNVLAIVVALVLLPIAWMLLVGCGPSKLRALAGFNQVLAIAANNDSVTKL